MCSPLLRSVALWLTPLPISWIMDAMSRTTESGALNIGWAATEDTSSVPGAYVSVTSIKP